MADQGKWFKLWISALNDPCLDNLHISDFGRWAKLGAYIKEQGTDGTLIIKEPSRTLCSMLQVDGFESLISTIKKLPHLNVERSANFTVTDVTNESVTYLIRFHNWMKYQGDFSRDRVAKFRAKNAFVKRSKRRGEEKRGEEKKIKKTNKESGFDIFWKTYPNKKAPGNAEKAWNKINPSADLRKEIMEGLERALNSEDWAKDGGAYIPHPATWLNGRRWEDEYKQKQRFI